jgi:hypothetical protein
VVHTLESLNGQGLKLFQGHFIFRWKLVELKLVRIATIVAPLPFFLTPRCSLAKTAVRLNYR